MKTKTTHIEKVAQQIRSNKEYVQAKFGIGEQKYYEVYLEAAMQFLWNIFPPETQYYSLAYMYSQDSKFWAWWRIEWLDLENSVVANHKKGVEMDAEIWEAACIHVMKDRHVETSFYNNYQRKLKHAIRQNPNLRRKNEGTNPQPQNGYQAARS